MTPEPSPASKGTPGRPKGSNNEVSNFASCICYLNEYLKGGVDKITPYITDAGNVAADRNDNEKILNGLKAIIQKVSEQRKVDLGEEKVPKNKETVKKLYRNFLRREAYLYLKKNDNGGENDNGSLTKCWYWDACVQIIKSGLIKNESAKEPGNNDDHDGGEEEKKIARMVAIRRDIHSLIESSVQINENQIKEKLTYELGFNVKDVQEVLEQEKATDEDERLWAYDEEDQTYYASTNIKNHMSLASRAARIKEEDDARLNFFHKHFIATLGDEEGQKFYDSYVQKCEKKRYLDYSERIKIKEYLIIKEFEKVDMKEGEEKIEIENLEKQIKNLEEEIKKEEGAEDKREREEKMEHLLTENTKLLAKLSLMAEKNEVLEQDKEQLEQDKEQLEQDKEQLEADMKIYEHMVIKTNDKINDAMSSEKSMSTSEFKKLCIKAGVINYNHALNCDVCHIIASSHGGADHPANYIIGLGASFNRMISDKLDELNCFLVGEERTKAAMEISNKLGNSSRNKKETKKYEYPYRTAELSAAKMCAKGRAMVQLLRKKVFDERKEKNNVQ